MADSAPKKKWPTFVMKGNGQSFLSGVWKGMQGGKSGARDIQVQFQDGREMVICSTVLTNMGQYFQAMLDCGLRETLEGKVTLPSLTSVTFDRLAAFTLGQRVELERREDLEELLEAAEMMQMDDVLDACVQGLQGRLSGDNCLETLALVRRFRPDKVQQSASLVLSSLTSVCPTEWCDLEEEDIKVVLDAFIAFPAKPRATKTQTFSVLVEAVFEWLEENEADEEVMRRLLSLLPFEKHNDGLTLQFVVNHSCLLANETRIKVVQECLKSVGEISLVVVGFAGSGQDGDVGVYCWSHHQQEWSKFPPPPEKIPQDFAITQAGNKVVISGGLKKTTGPSGKIWIVDSSGWKLRGSLLTARGKHGMSIVGHNVFVVGGQPGPLATIEKVPYTTFRGMPHHVGSLKEAVHSCDVTSLQGKLIVVGGCCTDGRKNFIQTFDTKLGIAEVITQDMFPGLQLDLGFCKILSHSDMRVILTGGGQCVTFDYNKDKNELNEFVQLKDFHHQVPFAAFADVAGVVVCDNRSEDCKYSYCGEKKEPTTLMRKLGHDFRVVQGFWMVCPSEELRAGSLPK